MARDVGGNDGVVMIEIEEAPTRDLNLIRRQGPVASPGSRGL